MIGGRRRTGQAQRGSAHARLDAPGGAAGRSQASSAAFVERRGALLVERADGTIARVLAGDVTVVKDPV